MLKPHRKPYGYKELLVYKKAEALQKETEELARRFPKTKTFIDLADQMNRSARSGKQNIVEGWKRNTTKEYYDFLGFSLAAVAELEEDCDDMIRGVHSELMRTKGIMGERGTRGEKGTHPTLSTPPVHSSHPTPRTPSTPQHYQPHYPPQSRCAFFSLSEIEKIPFYPLDPSLPPVIQLKLRAKELGYLIERLQKSLEQKMSQENTMDSKSKFRVLKQQKQKEIEFEKELREKYL